MTTRKKDLDTIKAFKDLLSDHGVWISYIENYVVAQNLEHAPMRYWHWHAWAMQTAPILWLLEAFPWNADNEDDHTWDLIHDEWQTWCIENLNK